MSITSKSWGIQLFDKIKAATADVKTLKKDGDEIEATASEINQLSTSANGVALKRKQINMTADDFDDDSEVGTGWSLPEKAIVKDVFLDVKTEETTATTTTLDVGTDSTDEGDADGFLAGVEVSSSGLVTGTVEDGAVTFGDLLLVDLDGTSNVKEQDASSGGKEITVTAGNSSGFYDVDFNLYVDYIEVE